MATVQLHGATVDKNGLYVDAGAVLVVGDEPDADITVEIAAELVEGMRAVEIPPEAE